VLRVEDFCEVGFDCFSILLGVGSKATIGSFEFHDYWVSVVSFDTISDLLGSFPGKFWGEYFDLIYFLN
jgi:hypothetical protein